MIKFVTLLTDSNHQKRWSLTKGIICQLWCRVLRSHLRVEYELQLTCSVLRDRKDRIIIKTVLKIRFFSKLA